MTQVLSSTPAPSVSEKLITLSMNGQKIQVAGGQSVLSAATSAGIYIPTLCHHPAISPHGGCRMCVVEIERQRGLQPACTFPASDGLVIQTETPRVVEARKFALEMLFSERVHYCMFCPLSGGEHTSDCELQRLAYRYELTHWQFGPNTKHRWPVDATSPHFVIDSSRCVLCRRCISACAELVANHTLGVTQRGARTMVCADDEAPIAEASCVSCGTCVQICPTGAIFDRRSAFCGHEADIQRTRSTCMACGVGCPIETVIRHNRVLRVEGVWDADNEGVLCEDGRFKVIENNLPRLKTPMIRSEGKLVACSWDAAISLAAESFRRATKVAGLITARSTNESLVAFTRLFHDIFRSDQVSLLSGRIPPIDVGMPGGFDDLRQADLIVVIGGDPWKQQKVLAYKTRRAVERGARLIIANAEPTGLERYADVTIRLTGETPPHTDPHRALGSIYHVRPDRLVQVREAIDAAERPLVMYGPGLDEQIMRALRGLPARTRFLPLVEDANAVGAHLVGLDVRPVQGDALYVMASDEIPNGAELPEAGFVVVQSSYRNRWTDRADVALPSKIWFEKQGHITNFEGRRMTLTRSVDAPSEVLSDWATLFMLSVKLGKPLSCITVSDRSAAALL